MPQQKSALNVVMGAMTFGEVGTGGARVHNIDDVQAILNVFRSHGHQEVDTARTYCAGTSEAYLGKCDMTGLKIETKLSPSPHTPNGITHTPEGLRKHLMASLKALNVDRVEIWYLHAPDRTVAYEVTMKAVDELHREGYFDRFGISGYMAFEVAEIVKICERHGYIKPTVYQGLYNALHRTVEPELFPCLRKFGLAFYEYNPLGGGFFTGKFTSPGDAVEAGSRFDDQRPQGKNYRNRYWNDIHFKAMAELVEVAKTHNLTVTEIALRWVSHHSYLKREFNDAILIGASSIKHIKENLIDLEKGPLPLEVVEALDAAWETVRPTAIKYWK
ncbi:Aldo/keto reductase [Mycena floridula]|nr:Aldo/keto reductase [Mycena floridula]